MNAFDGEPQRKELLLTRARDIATAYKRGVRAMTDGQYSWMVRKELAPLILPVADERCDDFARRSAACENFGAEYGIPARIAFVARALFDDMHEENGIDWPVRFVKAIPVGAELDGVWREFALFVLGDPKVGLLQYVQTAEQSAVIRQIIKLFEQRSADATAWEEAGTTARQLSYNRRGDGGHGRNAVECLDRVGTSAVHSAAYFATAFRNPQDAEEAVQWAAWPLRHLAEYGHYRGGERYNANVDDRGMVNVGDALWCAARNMADLHRAAHAGEEARWERYLAYSKQLVALIKQCDPNPGWFARVASGWNLPTSH